MAMSRDRVVFKMPVHPYLTTNFKATAAAAQMAFGLPEGMASDAVIRGIEITCRPSQFARFLIYREQRGGQNLFKELGARLAPAAESDTPKKIDVSKVPAGEGWTPG
jgi:hypothetical protein